jgi:hypothetical protein
MATKIVETYLTVFYQSIAVKSSIVIANAAVKSPFIA